MPTYPFPKTLGLLSLGLIASCGGYSEGHEAEEPAEATTPVSAPAALSDMTVAAGVHDLKCGCAIEGIGSCAPYAEVAGNFVELSVPDGAIGEHDLCGKEGVQAELAGEVKDGKLVASSFAYVE